MAERRRLFVEEKLDELLLRVEDEDGPTSGERSLMVCQPAAWWKLDSGRVSKSVIITGAALRIHTS